MTVARTAADALMWMRDTTAASNAKIDFSADESHA